MMNISKNPYLSLVHRNLPRLLGLYNIDTTDPLCGCGDRRYWAWKLIDFPNGTFQGAAFGLSKLLVAGLLPKELNEVEIQKRIEFMITVIPSLMDQKGAMNESLPNEGSFCVTGLVLADCLGAIHTLDNRLNASKREKLIQCLEPLSKFLMRQEETHGVISNHLATNALAMVRWSKMTGCKHSLNRAKFWLKKIQTSANQEGWMLEYSGADPGYQSWCSSALAQIIEISPDLDLEALVDKSYSFLEAFALPDGSFSNGCGSRMTRFLMTGGAEMQAKKSKSAARIASFARLHLKSNKFVTLDSIDELNLIPFFNDTVLAAVNAQEIIKSLPETKTRNFPNAGIYLNVNKKNISIINTKRGGWVSMTKFFKEDSTKINPEPVAKGSNGQILKSVRGKVTAYSSDKIIIQSDLEVVERMLPSPIKFIVLRLLSITAFKSLSLGNLVKRYLVKILLSESGKTVGRVERTIIFSTGQISDKVLSGEVKLIPNNKGFSPFHMASQGYWQMSDDTST